MEKKLFIPILLGTNRKGRESEKVAKLLAGVVAKRDDIETKLFDVRDFALPQNQYGQEIKEQFPEWRDAIVRADGLIIVAPEYNHGYPGVLKSVLDLLLREYVHKAVGLVGVSAGPWGGARVVEAMVPMVRELGLAVTFTDVLFPTVGSAFNDDGTPKDNAVYGRIDEFLSELSWMAGALRWGRENIPSKFHS